MSTHKEMLAAAIRGSRPGNGTSEIGPVLFEVDSDMIASCLTRPGFVRPVAYLEGLALIAGVDVSDQLLKMAPSMGAFADDGKFLGAYGPRAAMQLPRIIERLRVNPVSRQEILAFALPGDLYSKAKNIPCFSYFRFAIRDDAICITVHMRSNDAWRGFTYDVIMVWMVANVVMKSLDLDGYRIDWVADSYHIYDDTRDQVNAALYNYEWEDKAEALDLRGLESEFREYDYTVWKANELLYNMAYNRKEFMPEYPGNFYEQSIWNRWTR